MTFHNIALAIDFDARDTRVDLPALSTPNNAVDPAISSDQQGHVYAVWSDNRRGALSIYENSLFPGSGWLPRATPVNSGFPRAQDAVPGDATSPKVCSDNHGHVYVTWADDRGVKGGTGKRDIYFRYSKDYGITWYPEFTDERIDSDNPTIGTSKNPQIACDEKGNVYIAWEDDRNKTGFYEVYFRSLQVQFNKPTDFIVYYQTPEVRLNTGVDAGKYPALFPAISTDKNGSVYVAWLDYRNKPEDTIYPGIFFNASRNNGTTWETKSIHIDTAPVGGALTFSPPVISSDSLGDVYIAWIDNAGRAVRGKTYAPDGTTDVYFNSSHNHGVTWGKNDLRIEMPNTGDHRADVKDVAIGSNNKGVICIAWAEHLYKNKNKNNNNFDSNNIFINHSEDFGQSFLDLDANVRIDTGVAEGGGKAATPVLHVNNSGVIFASWVDNRHGTSDIYFNFSSDKGNKASWQKGDYLIDYPNPPGDSILPLVSADDAGHFYLVWQDTRSILTKDNYNIFFLSGYFDILSMLIEGQRLGHACFIATAAYGSPFEHHVELLRRFRDQYLLTNIPGKEFVTLYYRYSPPVADYILKHSYLKPIVRIGLMPAVGIATLCLHTSFIQKVVLIMVLLLGLGYLA
ncbi:MAG: hypothetical protein PH343_05075, partial [Nitrospira sp.]|nr:hypothetical protein [Nitrospira sp.]